MKISIIYNFKKTPWGGANQFLKVLKKELKILKLYEGNPYMADVVIFNSYPIGNEKAFSLAYKLKKKGKLIINRVDGPIHKYRGKDKYLDNCTYYFDDKFADATIFQSNWSKKLNVQQGMKVNQVNNVIFNSPDRDIFNRIKNKRYPVNLKKCSIAISSWSSNENKGFKVYKWLDRNLDHLKYEVSFFGRSPIKFENIKNYGQLNSKELASQLKRHDIYLTASINDPCSNSLLEALHCGLPAIAYNSGGHPEIIKKGGLLFNKAEEIPFLIDKIVTNYQDFSDKITLPDSKKTCNEYVKVASRVLESPTIKKATVRELLKINGLVLFGKLQKKLGISNE